MLAGILAVFAGCGANTETRSNSNTDIGTEAALPGEVPVIFDLPAVLSALFEHSCYLQHLVIVQVIEFQIMQQVTNLFIDI